MLNLRLSVSLLLGAILLTGLALPVFALEYNPGVTVGQYIKYVIFRERDLGLSFSTITTG